MPAFALEGADAERFWFSLNGAYAPVGRGDELSAHGHYRMSALVLCGGGGR